MLRKATVADFNFLYSLYMHPDINPFLLYEEMNKEMFLPVMKELLQKEALYIFSANDKDAGMCKLLPMYYRNSHIVYVGGVAINPAMAGKGLGIELMNEIIDLVKLQGFKRIELSVATSNIKAIRLYEKAGFQQEGILRKFTYIQKESKYIDEVLMSCLL
jgi:RimJ/RimL family protein N-acetyltransferase